MDLRMMILATVPDGLAEAFCDFLYRGIANNNGGERVRIEWGSRWKSGADGVGNGALPLTFGLAVHDLEVLAELEFKRQSDSAWNQINLEPRGAATTSVQ